MLKQVVGVPRVGSNQKTLKMLMNEPTSRRSFVANVRQQLNGLGGKGGHYIPPNPVAKPTVPSVASISTKNDPSTLMPQLVRDARYFSHREHGVEMGESMSL